MFIAKLSLIGAVVLLVYVSQFFIYTPQERALAYLNRGNAYFGEGEVYNLKKASQFYEKALRADAHVPDAWHQLARIDFLNGKFDEALLKINTQLGLHGEKLMASYYIRGLIYGYKKDFPNAEKDFKVFLEWDPENWAALNDLAWVYFAQGKFGNVEETASRGLAIAPTNPWLLTMRGMARFNMGNMDGSKADLELAQKFASELTEDDWIRSYPGNDPAVASTGLGAVRKTIQENLARVHKELAPRGE